MLLKQVLTVFLTALGGLAAMVTGPFDRSHNCFHWIARTHARSVLKVFGIELNVTGGEHVQPGQPYVYVANHASMFDIPAAIAAIPDRIHLIYKKELERIPLFGWGLKFGKTYIAIDRGKSTRAAKSLEQAIEKIRNGASVLLFAEGTRTPDGKLQPFKRGAFSLAVKAGVPIIPLTINGSYRILPRNTFRVTPGTITMVLDKPIHVGEQHNGKSEELRLMEEVHSILEKHYIEQ